MASRTEVADSAACCATPDDREWGRSAGRKPPLWWGVPVVFGLATAVILTIVILVVVRPPGPLDDPVQARQRDGLLSQGAVLPDSLAGVAFGGSVVVVLFERSQPSGAAYKQWRDDVTGGSVRLAVVLAGTPSAADLARAVDMPVPVDGGPPVGYAVVDADSRVRFSTLDPAYLVNAFEVNVYTGAVQ